MDTTPDRQGLAERFSAHRDHLHAVAYRMLGSPGEADDAVQEAWLHLDRAGASGVENLGGWLTTTVSRVCLDMLRSRRSRREESLDPAATAVRERPAAGLDPEHELVLADSVGLALLVVLDRLEPAERVAFVLHDLFAVPFDEIAPLVGRTEAATRQLASRARRRVQGADVASLDRAEQRTIVEAFLAALRVGDVAGLVAVLDPDVVFRADAGAGGPTEIRGAHSWARQAVAYSRGARWVQPVLVDGVVGVVLAPHGRLQRVLRFVFADRRIVQVDVVAEPARLAQLDLAVVS